MKSNLSYYKGSIVLTAICMILAYWFAGVQGAIIALVLSALEVSVSLDNAVVNAKVLKDMDEKWRQRFLTWGMLFSVFIVRVLFPILIVWATSPIGLLDSFKLPFQDPDKYAATVSAAHVSIAGYGGAFLMMVFLGFFLDEEKEHHWIPGLEHVMTKMTNGPLNASLMLILWGVAILAASAFALQPHIGHQQFNTFWESGVWGIATWLAVHALGEFLQGNGNATAAKTGFGAFVYLNILDASFSFDGVIGAFAVSHDIVVISAGLAAGAMFVRSMTIHMVDKGTLGELVYLEHGAFWSIGILAAMMFIGTAVHIPEIVTGLSAAGVLLVALYHSMRVNRASKVT